MRFHLFGLPHIPVAWERCGSRIATLVWNMARMLKRHGQEVVLYGAAGTDAPCDEFVEIVGPETLRTAYRADDPSQKGGKGGKVGTLPVYSIKPCWIRTYETRCRGFDGDFALVARAVRTMRFHLDDGASPLSAPSSGSSGDT